MPIRKKDDRLGAKKRFDPRTGEETNKPGGVDPRTIYRPKPDVKPTEMRTGGLSPKQKAIASKAPPPDKIDGKDFAVLKAEKAKGRGMGLQDESIKPGKVIKARDSKFIERRKKLSDMSEFQKRRLKLKSKKIGGVMKAKTGKMVPLKKDPTKPISSVAPKVTDALKKKKLPGRIGTALGIGSMLVPAAYAAAKQYKDYKSAKNRDKAKVKKYSKGGGADTGKVGEIKSKLSVAMDRASRRSRDKDRLTTRDKEEAINIIRRRSRNEDRMTNRDMESASSAIKGYRSGGHYDDKNKNVVKHIRVKKKMGGGMMQRPMGYKSGTMVKARGCKLGRSKPTKMY